MRGLAVVWFVAACGHSTSSLDKAGDDAADGDAADGDAPTDTAIDARAVDSGGTAAFHFDPSSLDLGFQPANVWSPIPLEIWVDGTEPLEFQTSISGPFSSNEPNACDNGEPVLPGNGCTIYIQAAPTVLGAITGSVSATAGGVTLQAELHATTEGAVIGQASGPGQIAVSPASVDCPGCYPGGTDVTITATPDAQAHLTGWSDPSCGTSLQCTFTAGVTAHIVTASFDFDMHALDIEFVGTGPGQVGVFQYAHGFPYQTLGVCSASCTVAVYSDDNISLIAASPVDIVAFGAPCPAVTTDPAALCDLPGATTSVTVDFERRAGEVDLFPPDVVYSVDVDAAGDLVLGTATGVVALSSSFTQRWRTTVPGIARFASDGNLYVLAADGIYKLDAGGNQLWFVAGGKPLPTEPGIGHDFATTPSGGFVIERNAAIEVHDSTGAITAQWTLDPYGHTGIAIAGDGTIYASIGDSSFPDQNVVVAAFTPDGTRVLPDIPASDIGLDDFGSCSIAVTATTLAFTQEGDADVLGVETFGLDGVPRWSAGVPYDHVSDFGSPTGVAGDSQGNLTWHHPRHHDQDFLLAYGMGLDSYAPSGALRWSVERWAEDYFALDSGLDVYDLAVMPDGRIVVGGDYYGFGDGAGVSTRIGAVQIFAP